MILPVDFDHILQNITPEDLQKIEDQIKYWKDHTAQFAKQYPVCDGETWQEYYVRMKKTFPQHSQGFFKFIYSIAKPLVFTIFDSHDHSFVCDPLTEQKTVEKIKKWLPHSTITTSKTTEKEIKVFVDGGHTYTLKAQ